MGRAGGRAWGAAGAAGLMMLVGHGAANAQKAREVLVAFELAGRTSADAIAAESDAAVPYVTNKSGAVWAEIRSGQNAFLTLGTHRTDSSRRFCVRLPAPSTLYATDAPANTEVCAADGQIHTGNGDSLLALPGGGSVDKSLRVHWHDPATDEGYFLSWGADLDRDGQVDTPPVTVTCVSAVAAQCSEWKIAPLAGAVAHLYRDTAGRLAAYPLEFTIVVRVP